ncbi:MAG: sodium:proton antiporter, partial [Planctomycetes bacterium]|nr:sodium:proton antiporter [Planctomycetota bacterium]
MALVFVGRPSGRLGEKRTAKEGRPTKTILIVLLLTLCLPSFAHAAEAAGKMVVPFWTALPFALLLGSIAVLPLIREHWWHQNRNKAIVSIGLSIPVVLYLLAINGESKGESTHQLVHELEEYSAFIILLTALYTISGGILLIGDIPARPRTNTLLLAIGAVLANFIGTTGASMVLIRPILRINLQREHKSHLPIFFIFIVSNTGGLLTPLGDPPLFLGFLQGVPFGWTLRLWPEWLLVNGALLITFYFWDTMAYRKETKKAMAHDAAVLHPLRLHGIGLNGVLLLGLMLSVLLSSDTAGKAIGQALGVGDLSIPNPWP